MLPKAKKEFGQNFLVDQSAIDNVVDAADIQEGETVLEIGPGTGAITQALVDAGAKVVAVEIDGDLIEDLRERFGSTVEVVHADIAEYDPEGSYKLVSSLPYNITSDILKRFLTTDHKPSRIVLVLQKEVCDRIVASPPKMSLLTVMCQLYADCTKIANIKAGAFRPIPKVDSAIIMLDPYQSSHFDGYDPEVVMKLARLGFSQKRKQLQKNLSNSPKIQANDVKDFLVELGLPQTARAENLTVENWVQLSQKFLV